MAIYEGHSERQQRQHPTVGPANPIGKHTSGQLKDDRDQARQMQKMGALADNYQQRLGSNQLPAAGDSGASLPKQLKQGIEHLSGLSMDDVTVNYNSAKPQTLQAAAYAQGSEIHLAPGQEQHLPHEAWHVVQQKQGRVSPTKYSSGAAINDSAALEHEADAMGQKALLNNNQNKPIVQKRTFTQSVKQLFARWYEFDGTAYHERWLGLPAATGWIPYGEHNGKQAWVSVTNLHRLPEVEQVTEAIQQVRQVVDQHTPLLQAATENIEHIRVDVEAVQQVQQRFISMSEALNNYLMNTGTVLKAFAVLFGLTGLVTGGYLLTFLSLPAWVVAAIDGLSFLYGAGLLYRWMKSKLLPVWIKFPLLIGNGLVMIYAAGRELGQVIAYLTELSQTMPFQHIQFAAIPFAILIEHLIVIMLEKVNALRQRANRQNGHNEQHQD